jgi:hypothetical protein
MLGQGFAPYLLTGLSAIKPDGTPEFQLEPVGFLTMLSSQSKPSILRLDTSKGHMLSAQIKYKKRYTVAHTSGVPSCDVTNVQGFTEASVDLTSFKQIAIHIADEDIAKYQQDASDVSTLGTPPTALMGEMVNEVMRAASAVLEAVNLDLQTIASVSVGVNVVQGNNLATPININASAVTNRLNDGMTKIMSDYKINLGSGIPQVVGSGLFYNYLLQQPSKSADMTGYDTSIMAAGVKFYHDLQSASILGTDHILVCQPNVLQWVEYLQYTGFKAGIKPGASQFFTIPLPMQVGSDIVPVYFDVQLRYNDCAQIFTDEIYQQPITLQKGYNLIISKTSGLFTIPNDAYFPSDRMFGNRGTLLYEIDNNCDICTQI